MRAKINIVWLCLSVVLILTGCNAQQTTPQPTVAPTAAVQAPATSAPTPAAGPNAVAKAVGTASAASGTTPGAPGTALGALPGASDLPAGGLPGGGGGMGMGQTFTATPAFANVAYASASNTQKLDIYLPQGIGPFPVVVNFHAGGFKFGDKTSIPGKVGQALLDAGYAVVGINYRLSGEAPFPAAVLDARAAIRFLRANAAQYKLDPDRMAVFGQSAGGNIAAMVGTTGDGAPFDDASLGNASVSNRVKAVVNWFGPTDFGQMDAQAKAQGCSANDQTHSSASSFESAYLGATVASSPDLVAKANPITYIDAKDPPFLVQKGDQDCTVAVENTKMLADALKAAGAPVEYDSLAGTGHGDTGSAPAFESDANVKRVVTWLDAHVK